MSAVQSAVSSVKARKGRAPITLKNGLTLTEARNAAATSLKLAKKDFRLAKDDEKAATKELYAAERALIRTEKEGDKAAIKAAREVVKTAKLGLKSASRTTATQQKVVDKALAQQEKVEKAPRLN
jgi:hypothetical protein